MANFTADNFTQPVYNGAYGNKSVAYAELAAIGTLAAGDTIDLLKLPGGARVLSGRIIIATAITTATLAVGIKYADGTSTGGTTGTAVMSGTGCALTTALAPQQLNFQSFVNDVDTVIYATAPNIAAAGANTKLTVEVDYIAEGTK